MLSTFISLCKSANEQACWRNTTGEDMCPVCVSRTGAKCGYCAWTSSCDAGDESGPFKTQCAEGWIFPKTTCTHEMCLKSTRADKCRHPCTWNKRFSKCVLPRDMKKDSEAEIKAMERRDFVARLIYALVVVFIAFAILVYLYGCYYNRKPLYSQIPGMNEGISLDDLPAA